MNHFEELPKEHQEEEDPHLEVPIFQVAHHSNHRVVELGQVRQVGHPMGAFPIPPCLKGEPSCWVVLLGRVGLGLLQERLQQQIMNSKLVLLLIKY